MKKNKMMRTASGLLVATLLTTSVISGTFAKYTTEGEGQDTARVAKWGITVSASGNLFGKEYAKKDATSSGNSIVATIAENTVKATDNKVVAPGTKNEEGFTVAIKGTPEVAYNVTATSDTESPVEDIFLGAGDWGVMVEATGLNAASDVTELYTKQADTDTYTKVSNSTWNEDETYYKLMNHVELTEAYYPIKWTVKNEDAATAISRTNNLTEIAAEMTQGLTKMNQNPAVPADASYTLTWEWPFGATDNNHDKADTILGNLVAAAEDNGTVVYAVDTSSSTGTAEANYTAPAAENYNLDIDFNMKVTVTQVD